MFKEIEELVDHLALIILISCVLGEAYARESCVDPKKLGFEIYLCMSELGGGEGGHIVGNFVM